MTERLMSIWKHVDRISNPNLADAIEASLVDDYLEEKCYIIPEEDWEEIQTRGYDIEMMCENADEQHADDPVWIETITNSLINQKVNLIGVNDYLDDFWRGYEPGTNLIDICIPELSIDGSMLF